MPALSFRLWLKKAMLKKFCCGRLRTGMPKQFSSVRVASAVLTAFSWAASHLQPSLTHPARLRLYGLANVRAEVFVPVEMMRWERPARKEEVDETQAHYRHSLRWTRYTSDG